MAITKVSRNLLNTGISDSSDATAITIDSDEKVGIGTTSPAEFLQVHGGIKTTGGFLANTANSMGMSYASNYGHFISWGDNSTQGKFKFTGTAGDGSPTGDLASLDSDGLKFGSDTAAANALDDYEEGTWTPTLPNGGTVNNNYASVYTKIGRFVNAYCYVNVTATNNSSVFQIGGLPYSGASIANFYGGGSLGYTDTLDVSSWSAPLVHPLNNFLYFHFNTTSTSTVLNSHLGGVARYLMINIIYKTD